MFRIMGETYKEVTGVDAVLWRGDLLLFDDCCGEDCKAYMVCIADEREHFNLVNYVGHKAGAVMAAMIPKEASQPGSMNIRLSWLRENWSEVIPIGSFETTKFFAWSGDAED